MITDTCMQDVFTALRTPVKHGIILSMPDSYVDCPNIFTREDGSFGMAFARFKKEVPQGYETWLAGSNDLLHWTIEGCLLPQGGNGWDACQRDGSLALIDPVWGGSGRPERFNDKVWMPYIGGALPGYEPDPLSIGMACGTDYVPGQMTCLQDPVLTCSDVDARPFEKRTLYKSYILHDREESLGAPFVMFYNAKSGPFSIEKIGIALSSDMVSWHRFGEDCVLHNGIEGRWNIAGDPQIIRMGDLWVMVYFAAAGQSAWDTFAVSRDLIHWTRWEGEPLIQPSESYDAQFAHKPWLIYHKDTVYHFYCAVGDKGRAIALATSR